MSTYIDTLCRGREGSEGRGVGRSRGREVEGSKGRGVEYMRTEKSQIVTEIPTVKKI